jgi:hypothetical protein
MNEFSDDHAWQLSMRNRTLGPNYYARYAKDGRYVYADKGFWADFFQPRGIDTILQGENGKFICVEEKIVRWKGRHLTAFCLETDSCTNPPNESEGWMRYCQADFLVYCFAQENDDLKVHRIDFPQLKAWFWPKFEMFKEHVETKKNRTASRLVPIDLVKNEVLTYEHYVTAGPA